MDDPRPSILSLYQSRDDYLNKIREAAESLIEERFLLPEDKPYVHQRAESYWDWIFEKMEPMTTK